MIRAVWFDFYGVWLPDIFAQYLAEAQARGPQAFDELAPLVNRYFHGQASVQEVAEAFRDKLGNPDIGVGQFMLNENSVAPAIIDFMRELHSHFVKVGVLANLGQQELQLLSSFNQHQQVFEVIASPLSLQQDTPLLSDQVFAAAHQAIGEPPANCLVVTGNPEYQSFAGSRGLTVVPFQGFPNLKAELEQRLASDVA